MRWIVFFDGIALKKDYREAFSSADLETQNRSRKANICDGMRILLKDVCSQHHGHQKLLSIVSKSMKLSILRNIEISERTEEPLKWLSVTELGMYCD